jgi:glycosyltransferase involved in cell wall biosynthesis
MWTFHKLQPYSSKSCRVGWLTHENNVLFKWRFDQLTSFGRMRSGNIGEWVNAYDDGFHNEVYCPSRRYDIVVFQKVMGERWQSEVLRIQAYGGKVIFDANVNYYDIWGDYVVPGTQPTEEQQRDAIWMTRHADWVVADSSYIAGITRKFNLHVTWIPDNVNLEVYKGVKEHQPKERIRLVWSGVGKKAQHLLLIRDVLACLKNIELVLVVDDKPKIVRDLEYVVPCRIVQFSDQSYAKTLLDCDVIISPKMLVNGYEMGHTEYKITLGMAVGLPAVASPQQSYIEAISHNNGGVVANTNDDWFRALTQLVDDHQLRSEMGARARQTVLERYSTPVIARQYLRVFQLLTDRGDESET